jgi:DNA-binding MarR family transcriptional regulator
LNAESRHELNLLEAVEQNGRVTQRGLAAKLGIALGLTNIYVKRLVRKGYIKCVNIQSNRVSYLITPKGIAEKARLTYEFMEYSLQIYRRARSHLRSLLEPYAAGSSARIAIYGTGEAAELAYLCLRELGLEPAVVFDDARGGNFFGIPVVDIRTHSSSDYDHLIIGTMEDPHAMASRLIACGVPASKLLALRPPEDRGDTLALNRA